MIIIINLEISKELLMKFLWNRNKKKLFRNFLESNFAELTRGKNVLYDVEIENSRDKGACSSILIFLGDFNEILWKSCCNVINNF